jgi:predicted acyltransferase (DUF342 family)
VEVGTGGDAGMVEADGAAMGDMVMVGAGVPIIIEGDVVGIGEPIRIGMWWRMAATTMPWVLPAMSV